MAEADQHRPRVPVASQPSPGRAGGPIAAIQRTVLKERKQDGNGVLTCAKEFVVTIRLSFFVVSCHLS